MLYEMIISESGVKFWDYICNYFFTPEKNNKNKEQMRVFIKYLKKHGVDTTEKECWDCVKKIVIKSERHMANENPYSYERTGEDRDFVKYSAGNALYCC